MSEITTTIFFMLMAIFVVVMFFWATFNMLVVLAKAVFKIVKR